MSKRCNHDEGLAKVYSGQINISRKFAWICWRCGEHGWSSDYVLHQVNLAEYQRQRVAHGWGGPVRLPPPPPLPTNTEIRRKRDPVVAAGAVWFLVLSAVCLGFMGVQWPGVGALLPTWAALLGSGVALGTSTLLYIVWKVDG